MRAYGQKRVYGKYITRVVKYKSAGKIHIETLVKNRKRERQESNRHLIRYNIIPIQED